MKTIKLSVIIILAGIILSGCKEKNTRIEIVPNLESIYSSMGQVDVPPKSGNDFEAKAETDLVDAVRSVLDKKLQFPLVYKIRVRLFINEQGGIDKLKDMGNRGAYLDSGRNLHFVPTDGLDNAIASNISNWKFTPAIKNGKPVKVWTDLNVDIPIKPDGTYIKFELPDFLSNLPSMNDFIQVDTSPTVTKSEIPHYPEIARRAGIEGTAYVKVLVDREGNPLKAVVIKCDNAMFSQPSIDAAMKFKFSPAYQDDKPVAIWVVIPFRYKLGESKGELMHYKDLKKMPPKK